MSTWTAETIERIAASDDLHIAPYHPDGRSTGTLTWIWSVVVDGRLSGRVAHTVVPVMLMSLRPAPQAGFSGYGTTPAVLRGS
jgi:hypothetical protein